MNSSDTTLPNGPAWAAILAASIGCVTFGLLVDLAAASHAISNSLNFYNPTGDLSGKSTVAIAAWLIIWAVLHARWKKEDVRSPGGIMVLSVVLILLAMIAVFPPVVGIFERV
jgi:hypothetical protein